MPAEWNDPLGSKPYQPFQPSYANEFAQTVLNVELNIDVYSPLSGHCSTTVHSAARSNHMRSQQTFYKDVYKMVEIMERKTHFKSSKFS